MTASGLAILSLGRLQSARVAPVGCKTYAVLRCSEVDPTNQQQSRRGSEVTDHGQIQSWTSWECRRGQNSGLAGAFMRIVHLALAVCAALAGSGASAPAATMDSSTGPSKVTPLILEKNEGERRVWRPIEGAEGWEGQPGPFILKIDPRNGGSSHMVLGTEDLPPGRR
jgi:hypothetical protein